MKTDVSRVDRLLFALRVVASLLIVASLAIGIGSTQVTGVNSALTVDASAYDPSSILVRFRQAGALEVQSAAILTGTDIGPEIPLVPGLHQVRLAPGVQVADALAAYRGSPLVEYAEPDFLVRGTDTIPNDPMWPELYGMRVINAPTAWDYSIGTTYPIVAVLDTGADYNHLDLYQNIWINQGEIPYERWVNLTDIDFDGLITFYDLNDPINQGPDLITDVDSNGRITAADILAPMSGSFGGWANGSDDDFNGRVDDLAGWNFVSNNGTPLDDNGHGSHTSGTVGAQGNNGVGVTGVNWKTQIIVLKFMNASGAGSIGAAINALNYAVANGARVSNNSWGGGGFSLSFQTALQNADAAGHLFVAAAGSSNRNIDVTPFYPASYPIENVVAVMATTSADTRPSFSNYGASTVDLGAPGSSIRSTWRDGLYTTSSGTSQAAPHVAGALALVTGRCYWLSHTEVRDLIFATVDQVPGTVQTITRGRLNVGNAMAACAGLDGGDR